TEELTITNTSNIKSITINGEDQNKTIFDGQNKTRLFNLNTTTLKVNFNNITFANGNNIIGGAIYTGSTLDIKDSKFINNTAYDETKSLYGGAIFSNNNASIYNTIFYNNKADPGNASLKRGVYYGGALYLNGTNYNISFCEFNNNIASQGGIIYDRNSKSIINVTYCNFFNNHAFTSAIEFRVLTKQYPKYLINSVFNNNKCTGLIQVTMTYNPDLSGRIYGNYYVDGSNTSSILFTANGKKPVYVFNQKTNITLKCVSETLYADEKIQNLGRNYELPITSSSNLLNVSDIKLTPKNNYTATIDISKLPSNYENITLFIENTPVCNITCDYINIKFDNITSKPGKNIILKAELSDSSNRKLHGEKVAFKINGCTIGHSKIEFGVATLNYTIPSNYSAKNYTLTLVYGGNSKLIKSCVNSTLHLDKIKTSTNLTTSIEGNTLKINVDPKDENGNTVKTGKICVKIEGKTLQNLKIKGKTTVNFTIPKSWNNREIKVLAIYGENGQYISSRSEITTKLTLPKTEVKEVKKDEVVNNYYVSDLTGSDSNSGTQTSPFKTIQKAISTVNTNKQNANIYLNGQFKGLGNTNLTVPGDLYINFIGVGNSSIDGEVNYTIKTVLDEGEYYWGSTPIWYPYNNDTGNWAMNITKGKGLITINNLTIKNCWSPGNSSISAYPTATVDNYGNLAVNNVSFIFNHAGVGAGIRNNNGSNLNVTDSLFEENRKSSSTGNYGVGIYNNGTAIIINSTFQKNYARWGTITNDKNLTIINSTIRDNIGYDGGSTYKTGSGITINTASTDFYSNSTVENIITVVDGCTFRNNDQLDISADKGNLNLINNIFNQSTGVVTPSGDVNFTHNIINNTFDSPITSTLYTSLSNKDPQLITLQLRFNKYLIENNTVLNMNGSTSNALLIVADNAVIQNNTFTRKIQIMGNNNQVIMNNITTTQDTYAVNIIQGYKNNNISSNYLSTTSLKGNAAVDYLGSANIISNNTPITTMILVDDNVFYKFFDDDGNLRPEYNMINQIEISGNLTNKNININQDLQISQRNKDIKLENITINANNNLKLNGLKIENTNEQPIVVLNNDNNIITNTTLKTNGNNTIIVNGKNNTITQNNLLATILVGNESIKTTNDDNNISDNTPTYKNYLINDKTYNEYFTNTTGEMKEQSGEIHILLENLNNKKLVFNTEDITINSYNNTKSYNITIISKSSIILDNVNIINTNMPILQMNAQTSIINSNLTGNSNIINITNTTTTTITNSNINSENTTKPMINLENIGTLEISENTMKSNTTIIQATNIQTTTIKSNNLKVNTKTKNTSYAISIINTNTTGRTTIESNDLLMNGENTTAINVENQKVSIGYNDITTEGQQAIGIQTKKVENIGNYDYINSNTIQSSAKNTYGIVIIESRNLKIGRNNLILNGENTTAIQIKETKNATLQENTIESNGTKAVEIINSQEITINKNDITTITEKEKISPIIVDNSNKILITNNIIITSNDNTITINNNSENNKVELNKLYALKKFGDDSVEADINLNTIRVNTPNIPLYIILNDKTYTEFFDEKGQLRENVPVGTTIQLTGNTYNKILNITRPINIISDGLKLQNCQLIIGENASNTNISTINFKGEQAQITIDANNTNININSIEINNIKSENISLIKINGNQNNIEIEKIIIESKKTLNSNITVIEIQGKENQITPLKSIETNNFNNVTMIQLNNTTKNNITSSFLYPTNCNYVKEIELINSDKNILNINQQDGSTISNKYSALELINSSNNIIHTNIYNLKNQNQAIVSDIILSNSSNNIIDGNHQYNASYTNGSRFILLDNNSNNNRIHNSSIRIDGYTQESQIPIIINNSHYNQIYNNTITTYTYEGYVIDIIEGMANRVEYNIISTMTLDGNNAVLQENKNDTINNNVLNNLAISSSNNMRVNITTSNIIKINSTTTITATIEIKNGTGWSAPYIPVTNGSITFIINGEKIGKIEVDNNGIAQINYTLKPTEDLLYFEARYDGEFVNQTTFGNKTPVMVSKLDTKILLTNTTNTGSKTNIITMVIDENGNIVYNGKIAFKINQKIIDIVNIKNGIAQITLDTSKYQLKIMNYTQYIVKITYMQNLTVHQH
ncbi:beta strand repeat-containing protein, partial [Methanosphaera cuniculi]|uniref:beta strand repeat-containing protein n=1 Tax=Methanosphaera cuniculi TaxID=1077256 RepID=UPI0026DC0743